MIHGTAAVGGIVLYNIEQAATARGGRENVLPGTGSSISVMAGDKHGNPNTWYDTATNRARMTQRLDYT